MNWSAWVLSSKRWPTATGDGRPEHLDLQWMRTHHPGQCQPGSASMSEPTAQVDSLEPTEGQGAAKG